METSSPLKIEERADGPRLVLRYGSGPRIQLDVRFLDRVTAADDRLYLQAGEATSFVSLRSGVTVALEIAGQLAAFTRSATSTCPEVCVDLKRRLQIAERGFADDAKGALYFDDLDLYVDEENVVLGGEVVGRTLDLVHSLERDETFILAHPRGQYALQAAFGNIYLVARFRPREDPTELRRRLHECECVGEGSR
jgi:hypothetical protein